MSDDARRSRAVLIALIAGVGVVVVIALIAVFARGGPAQLDPDTPEGVVQRYSQAVAAGDATAAMEYLSPEVADDCVRMPLNNDEHRVTLLDTTEKDDTARVVVLIATTYGSDPLGSGTYESEGIFELVDDGGTWYIEVVPWELAVCEGSL